ncbi:MAG: NAD(P)H-hydrate dehydratase [Melioribacteraceae bacterium]|nr:NAD(P)H-hydrate dehydratase [Melioribacteraceae bacterium]
MIPLYSSEQIRALDNYAIQREKMPSIILMENAAINILKILREKLDFTKINTTLILCGKGNNAGDGFALARHLVNHDNSVYILLTGSEKEYPSDAKTNFDICKQIAHSSEKLKFIRYKNAKSVDSIGKIDLIIDALLGTGFKGKLENRYKTIIEKFNNLTAIRVAIDSPTGLTLATSTGEVIFNSNYTITLGGLKSGLFYGKGYENGGSISFGAIGIRDSILLRQKPESFLLDKNDALAGLPEKNKTSNKYSAGKVLVIAGSAKYVGAAILTSNAVFNSGAGACYLAIPDSMKSIFQTKSLSTVAAPYNDSNKKYLTKNALEDFNDIAKKCDVIAIGPGIGREEETLKEVSSIIKKYNKRVVIDADALTLFKDGNYKKHNLKNAVLTPHHGEFASMLSLSVEELESDIMKFGKAFVKSSRAYLVLKGAPTIIFSPDGGVFINSTGNSGMSKFGSGDVLTGIIAGFLAQSEDLKAALLSAVYLHSLSADLLLESRTEFSILPTQISNNLSKAIKYVRKQNL